MRGLRRLPQNGSGRGRRQTGDAGVCARERFRVGQSLAGPAVITETVSTTWLAPDWTAQVDAFGNLLLQHTH